MSAPQLPPLPQRLPKTQAEWQQLLNNLQAWQRVLGPLLSILGDTAATATAGTQGAPPAQVAGYLILTKEGGATLKIPYYAP